MSAESEQDDLIEVEQDEELSFAPVDTGNTDDLEVVVASDDAEEDEGESEDSGEPESAAADEDEAEQEDDGVETPEDLADYSTKVQKRIMREVRQKHEIRARAEAEVKAVREQAVAVTTQLRNEGKRAFDEVQALRAAYDRLEDEQLSIIEQWVSDKKQLVEDRLKHAKEQGDTEAEVKYLSELQTLANQQAQIHPTKRTMETRRASRAQLQNVWDAPPAQQPQQRQAQDPGTQEGAKWKSAHKWFGKNEEATEFAHTVDRKLVREGLNPRSKEFFAELDRRISKRFPELYARKAPKQNVAPVAGSGRSSSASRPTNGKIVLKKSDLAVMRRFGLDPNNKVHLREFALQKRASA